MVYMHLRQSKGDQELGARKQNTAWSHLCAPREPSERGGHAAHLLGAVLRHLHLRAPPEGSRTSGESVLCSNDCVLQGTMAGSPRQGRVMRC